VGGAGSFDSNPRRGLTVKERGSRRIPLARRGLERPNDKVDHPLSGKVENAIRKRREGDYGKKKQSQ